jgi:signal transduction histidine kinase
LHILCDAKSLQVVFTNILLNAIEVIGEKGTITITVKEKTESIMIEVENTGPPISHDVANKIFDPLFATKQSGSGLGLATSKNIIEQHGGTINVRNNPNTFIIILPKRSSKFNDDLVRENPNRNSSLV